MASDLNQVAIGGRLTRDPEVKGNGNVLSLRLASNARKKDGDEWSDVAGFYDVVVFGESRVAALAKFLHRGGRVTISGRLDWREWESDGGRRQAVQIIANDVQIIDWPDDEREVKPGTPEFDNRRSGTDTSDDIPF